MESHCSFLLCCQGYLIKAMFQLTHLFFSHYFVFSPHTLTFVFSHTESFHFRLSVSPYCPFLFFHLLSSSPVCNSLTASSTIVFCRFFFYLFSGVGGWEVKWIWGTFGWEQRGEKGQSNKERLSTVEPGRKRKSPRTLPSRCSLTIQQAHTRLKLTAPLSHGSPALFFPPLPLFCFLGLIYLFLYAWLWKYYACIYSLYFALNSLE